jgi:hypothetical protein
VVILRGTTGGIGVPITDPTPALASERERFYVFKRA